MFAWVHQALASEKELLDTLFGCDNPSTLRATSRNAPDASTDERNAEAMPESTSLINKVFEGIARPLKVRVEQVRVQS